MSFIESPERGATHHKISRFLERTGFGLLSQNEKIARLRSMTFQDFFALLSRLNGQLRNLKIKEHQKSTSDDSRMVKDRNDLEIAYIPPTHGPQLLQDFFEQMKAGISEDNLAQYAVKLRYAIVFAHIFDDGNGRTARYTERLLTGNRASEEDAVSGLESCHEQGAELANQLALFEIFREEVPEEDQRLFEIKIVQDIKVYTMIVDRRKFNYGFAFPLKFLALRKTCPDVSIIELMRGKKYWDSVNDKPETKADFDLNYTKLQDKLFWKVQELLDREPNISKAESGFRNRIDALEDAEKKRVGYV